MTRADLVDLPGGRSLVVAGDLTVDTLVSSGVVLVQRSLRAHTVVIADLTDPPGNSPRFVGWQVGESLTAQILDSPRFGLACPITCDGIVRFAGKTPDPLARERARQRLTKPVWRTDERGIDEALMMERLRG